MELHDCCEQSRSTSTSSTGATRAFLRGGTCEVTVFWWGRTCAAAVFFAGLADGGKKTLSMQTVFDLRLTVAARRKMLYLVRVCMCEIHGFMGGITLSSMETTHTDMEICS